MTISTLIRYLFGQRSAILEVAESRSAVWLGLLFVISAGFAREYDGEDLLHEPWHLALPLVASLATSFLLFSVAWIVSTDEPDQKTPFWPTYRMFLGLYWMTAPLAWLYAVPVEQAASAAVATQANLWLLGIVSVWRVLLMMRVIGLLFQARWWQAMMMVMLFADTVALTLLAIAPLPVVSLMGGIRLSESERLISDVAFSVGFLGVISWPIWFLGSSTAVASKRPSRRLIASLASDRRTSRGAWAMGVVSVLLWVGVLPITQPQQQLRREVERDLRGGQIERGLATMSNHDRNDFPPHWDPPPRIGYGQTDPPILTVIEIMQATNAKPWVQELFLLKLQQNSGHRYDRHLERMESDRFDQLLGILEQLPKDSPLFENYRRPLADQLEDHSIRSEAQQARIRALLADRPKK